MDNGQIISAAWRLTWRYRFLWVLGLFAGGPIGSCTPGTGGQFNTDRFNRDDSNGTDLANGDFDAGQTLDDFGAWLGDHLGLVLAVAALVVLVVLALFVIRLIAQGGMARATAQIAAGERPSLGEAWRAGLRLLPRFFGLFLIQIGLVLALLLIAGIVIGVPVGIAAASGGDGLGAAAAVVAGIGVLLFLLSLILVVPLTISVTYAYRFIAMEGAGAMAALGAGWRLLRANVGASLLLWLISIALGIGAGIAIGIAIVIALIPLAIVGVVIYFAAGGGATVVYAAGAAMVAFAALWVLSGINSTYFWHYWTLAFYRLTGRAVAAV